MASLTFLVLVLGVVMPCVLGQDQQCPDSGDDSVDWTKKADTWYYCQSSLKSSISNCYLDVKPTGENELEAVVYQVGEGSAPTDPFKMTHVAPGKYYYPGRKTSAVNMAVANGNPGETCLTYWKCPEEGATWNEVKPGSSYFMFMCNKPSLCKPQTSYEGGFKDIFEKAVEERKLTDIVDLPQDACKEKYADKY